MVEKYYNTCNPVTSDDAWNEFFTAAASENTFIIADASFLLRDAFFNDFYPRLVKYNISNNNPIHINICSSTISTLKKYETNENDTEYCVKASNCLNIIFRDSRNGFNFNIQDYSGTKIQNLDIIRSSLQKRLKNKVIVLTQNFKLSHDIYYFNFLKSYYGQPLSCYRINDDRIPEKYSVYRNITTE